MYLKSSFKSLTKIVATRLAAKLLYLATILFSDYNCEFQEFDETW